MMKIDNNSGVFNARMGHYDGGNYVFTHRDPKTGDYWSDDIPISKKSNEYGKWVPGDSVKIMWDKETV